MLNPGDTYATRSSWNTVPIEHPQPVDPPTREWTQGAWERLRHGFIPAAMEQKWFAFVEGHRLFLHRSWTGAGIYEVAFEQTATGWRMSEVIVEAGMMTSSDPVPMLVSIIDSIVDPPGRVRR